MIYDNDDLLMKMIDNDWWWLMMIIEDNVSHSLLWKFELNLTSGTLSRTTLSSIYVNVSVEDMTGDWLDWLGLGLWQ